MSEVENKSNSSAGNETPLTLLEKITASSYLFGLTFAFFGALVWLPMMLFFQFVLGFSEPQIKQLYRIGEVFILLPAGIFVSVFVFCAIFLSKTDVDESR